MIGRLDLFYRGDRDYLQGSLIVSQATEWYRNQILRSEGNDLRLTGADFRSIVNNHCLVTDLPGSVPDSTIKGTIRLAAPDTRDAVLAVLLDPERPDAPARHEDSQNFVQHFELSGELSGTSTYRHDRSLNGILATIIETNKRCHQETFPGARNIWFLSFSSSGLKVADSSFAPTGSVKIANQIRRTIKGRMLSVSEVNVQQDNGVDLDLNLVFSCEI